MTKASKHISGFCGIGLHEGTRPRNIWGTAQKVCTILGLDGEARCNCKCHKEIDEMYESAGMPRVPQQNPDWKPPPRQDLSYVWADSLVGPVGNTSGDGERPAVTHTDAGIAVDAPRYSGDDRAPSGTRRRGQLEEEVQRICVGYLEGEFSTDEDGYMSTKHIAHLIDPEDPPSSGAVHSVLLRWEKIGYAVLNRDPMEFALLTPDGMKMGLNALKSKAKASRKVRRV